MTKAQIERRRMRRLKKIVRGTMKFFGLSYECPMEYRKDFKRIFFENVKNALFVFGAVYFFIVMFVILG